MKIKRTKVSNAKISGITVAYIKAFCITLLCFVQSCTYIPYVPAIHLVVEIHVSWHTCTISYLMDL